MEMDRMIDDVIRKFGFEARQTIGFCGMVEECEKGNLEFDRVKARYEWLMERQKNRSFLFGLQRAAHGLRAAEIPLYHSASSFVKRFPQKYCTKILPEIWLKLPIDF